MDEEEKKNMVSTLKRSKLSSKSVEIKDKLEKEIQKQMQAKMQANLQGKLGNLANLKS